MKQMYNYIAAFVLLCSALSLSAQEILKGNASVVNVKIGKVADRMFVSMDIIPNGKWKVKSNQSIVLTPSIAKESSEVLLPQVQIMGKNRYLHRLRNVSETAVENQFYKASKTQSVHYEISVTYEKWMDNSTLILNEDLCGCCQTLLVNDKSELKQYNSQNQVFTPVFAYAVPKAEVIKERCEAGRAYVAFHVSRTDIDSTYLSNKEELQKIVNTIELVRMDADVTMTGILLKGYASPEGNFKENEQLAKNRTEAVATYIRKLFGESDYPVSTSYEAENWEGLKEFISQSNLSEKEQLLVIIESPAFADNPDGREWKIKNTYPDAYRKLLIECYPFLRRTDYRVNYTVRSFNVEEAKKLIETCPQKLSLQEMYRVAQTYQPGSDAYNNVFDTAVRLFPNDTIANLNAANSALQRGDTVLAEKYLAKAGDTGEAIVARGILAMLKGNAKEAAKLMERAQTMGIEAASSNLKQIQTISK